MFSGIVRACVPVVKVEKKPGLITLTLVFPEELIIDLTIGASVAVDGVCLTVVSINNNEVTFDLMAETLERTTLGAVIEGRKVNVERSLKFGDEVGGHLVSGHVSEVGTIIDLEKTDNNHKITIQIPQEFMKYVFSKGFIALDGASLTVVDVDYSKNIFSVWLIPETLRITTFGFKGVGDKINFEIEAGTRAMVDTLALQHQGT